MPARLLKHVATAPPAAATPVTIYTVPASRAFVGKVVVANTSGAASGVNIGVGGSTVGFRVLDGYQLGPGESLEQTIVAVASEPVTVQSSVAAALTFTLMGEEVDN